MKIEILGVGCPKCRKLYENACQAIRETGIAADITKVTGLKQIGNYGVMITPALVIDGQVKSAGKIPTAEEIKSWIIRKE